MKRIIAVALLFIFVLSSPLSVKAAPAFQTGAPVDPRLTDVILQAVRAAIPAQAAALGLTQDQFAITETYYSKDQTQAVLWLARLDPDSGFPIAAEPILAVVQGLDPLDPANTAQLKVIFQVDAAWDATLQGLPAELHPLTYQENPGPRPTAKDVAATTTFGGYLLPWANSLTKSLTMGANHVSCPTTCTYAFDFADGSMFPILAAKGGSVFYWRDSCQNNDHSCTNSLTLEDRSTNPVTYQIYLHLAQNSIPSRLKVKGTLVQQGDFLANADNTGYSTGSHLHFMVVTNTYLTSAGYYWGYSVDVTFQDVNVNVDSGTKGGRPCLGSDVGYGKCKQYQSKYTSGNHGTHPPSGDMTLPGNFLTVAAPTVAVSGWGKDDMSVTRMQIVANYDGSWKEVGPAQTVSPFAFDLDLCAAGIPAGPVSLGLKVYDYEGNQTPVVGLRNLLKTYACAAPPPPPTCTASADQVALFTGPNFEGACQVYTTGSYPNASSLGKVGGANAESIQVGANVSASLFSAENYTGRAETLTSSVTSNPLYIRNLSSHLIGANRTASLKVQKRTDKPITPVLNPAANLVGLNPTVNDSLVLSWKNAGGATKFKAILTGTNLTRCQNKTCTLDFSTDQSWSVGSLPAGSYTWSVQGRVSDVNNASILGDLALGSFTVDTAASLLGTVQPVPYLDGMQNGPNGWTATGLWRQVSLPDPSGSGTTVAWTFNNAANNYADSQVRSGDLTSPPIAIPAAPTSYLRFSYQYQTESAEAFFDQRRIQVSSDGGAFRDLSAPLSLLTDDSMQTWLGSPAINLSAYAGHTIRVRFHFDAIDANLNGFSGWAIDDVKIDAAPPPTCSESAANNSYAQATAIAYGGSLDGQICPAGDIDFYKFNGRQGDVIQADVIAGGLNPPSPLDSTLTLLASDGQSVLAFNDDVQTGVNSDSRVTFVLPGDCLSTCFYYLKVKAWNYPGAGDAAYRYRLTLSQPVVSGQPSIAYTFPGPNGYVSANPFSFRVKVADSQGGSGISHVDFFVHSSDWLNDAWNMVASDWNGEDGWSGAYDPSGILNQAPYAAYARVTDWTGSTAVALVWNLVFDKVPPQTALASLPGQVSANAFRLQFSGSDDQSGVGYYNLQYKDNGSAWIDYPQVIPASQAYTWFIGQNGHTYTFQERGLDLAGNPEAWHAPAQAATKIQADCSGDALENDDVQSSARPFTVDGPAQMHTFCAAGDVDWVSFPAVAGDIYSLLVLPTAGSPAAPEVALFKADGTQIPGAGLTPAQLGSGSTFKWTAPASEVIYLRLRSINPAVIGGGTGYSVWVGHGTWLYFPLVSR